MRSVGVRNPHSSLGDGDPWTTDLLNVIPVSESAEEKRPAAWASPEEFPR